MDILIFVALGTQDKSFKRLLKAVDKQIEKGNIKDKVIVQAGNTKYKSKNMEIFDFVSNEKNQKYMEQANLIITHGGVGIIMECLRKNKKIIAVPRLKKYGEHDNDHQIQIIEAFSEKGYLIPLEDLNKLDEALKKAKTFKPKKFISNTYNMVKLIENYIDNL